MIERNIPNKKFAINTVTGRTVMEKPVTTLIYTAAYIHTVQHIAKWH